MDNVKDQILDYVFNKITNPDYKSSILVLCGSPGVGKTNLLGCIADCLDLPLIKIALGGIHDASKLHGHSRTYIDSMPGVFVKGMCDAGCINPVIFMDEIDKVRKSNGGNEIEGVLTHILDPLYNTEFTDEYMAIPIDLSKVIWVASCNDIEKIGPIVGNRMRVIYVNDYTKKNKLEMTKSHLMKQVMDNLRIDSKSIIFTDDVINHVIDNELNKEPGVRNLLRCYDTICSRVNRMQKIGKLPAVYEVTTKLCDESLSHFNKTETSKIPDMYI
jgi:ATP-dependent Lon protease